MDEIHLRLDRESAQALYDHIDAVGEYHAAGAPLPPFSADMNQRLTTIFKDLERQLGIESMADAMQREIDKRSRTHDDY